jgi:hypothetical protein
MISSTIRRRIFLFGIAAHIRERQHRDRRLVGQRQCRSGRRDRGLLSCCRRAGRLRARRPRSNAIGADRAGNVLERLLADVLEGEVEAARGVLLNPGRDADAAGLGQPVETGGDVDAVAEDIAILDHNVADIDADAELDAAICRHRGVALGQSRLYLGRASESVDDAGELDQQAVAGGLDDAAPMPGDPRIDELGAERPEPTERPFLVSLDEA